MRRLSTVMIASVLLPGLLALAGTIREARGDQPGTQGGQPHTRSVCHGFVVLPNGFAVLSGVTEAHQPGQNHAHGEALPPGTAMAHQGHGSRERIAQSPGAPQHLLGYIHGQDIVPQGGMLCVSIGGGEAFVGGRKPGV